MNRYTVYPNAKINIGLNIYKKNQDGYHDIDSIMIPIDLKDELDILFLEKSGKLNISCSDVKIPTDEKNILYKTYKKFFEKTGKEEIEINIFLKKNIPSEAGLGGGSADAGAFLNVLNEYYENYFSMDELKNIALEIGSDVPFFIENKAARISGKGEKIKILENNLSSSLILLKPDFGISTKEAYENFDKLGEVKYSNLDNIEKSLIKNDIYLLEESIENGLEQAIHSNFNIKKFKNSLKAILHNKKIFMTGSGSVFYIFISEKEIDFLETRLKTFLDNTKVIICNIKK